MAKKRTPPASSSKSIRKTEAPKRVTAPAAAAVEATPVVVDVAPVVEVAPIVAEAAPVALDHWTIARRAYAKFAARGYVHGHHVQDWLEAEAELRA